MIIQQLSENNYITLNCIAIDDDPLFLACLKTYIKDITWIDLLAGYNNPIQGATAIISQKPDLILLDIEMPYVDGNYLLDWIKPQLMSMHYHPEIVLISSLINLPDRLIKSVSGFIDKSKITNHKFLEEKLMALLNR